VPVAATAGILVGLVLGWEYSMPPLALAWRRSGEVTNALLGGLLLPVTGALVAGAPLRSAVIAFLPFTLLAFVDLLETQWPDRVADRAVGKNTLASSLSLPSLRRLAVAAVIVAYVALGWLPTVVAVATLAALPLSVWGVLTIGRRPPGPSVAAMVVAILAQGVAWAWLA
jgi:1,4-dihydroxy-2-naphthoate octaprenyltransferase